MGETSETSETSETIEIGGRRVGLHEPTYVIAELSANHGQRLERAIELVHAAKQAGADAVKLQTYTPDTITIRSDLPQFVHEAGSPWSGKTLYDLYAEAYMPWEWQPQLKTLAESLGMQCFSSPFDPTAVDFLESIGVPAFKVASFELVDIPLVERMARTGKPLILSTGMATMGEIEEAVSAARRAGCKQIALLKCTSAYPAPVEEMHLRTLPHLAQAFGAVVGLSDHTLGITVPIVAVALGASIIEKHMTLRRADGGPDAEFSLEPQEMAEMICAVRVAERALGRVHYGLSPKEAQSRKFRRSLYAVEDIGAGEELTECNVRSIRPAAGLAPRFWPDVQGRQARVDIVRGTPLAWEHMGSRR